MKYMNVKRFTPVCLLFFCGLQLSWMKSFKQDYLEIHASLAVKESIRYGIPASIKLAQSIIETNWGTSDLATKANNYFGIKCKENWEGNTFMHVDDDRNASGALIPSCFRAYPSVLESWEDHSRFLKYRRFYVELFKLEQDDYIGWAKGLKKAGYATDPKYDEKLINIIEQYDLYKYDKPEFRKLYSDYSSGSK